MPTAERFAKTATDLHRPAGERVRTNNHVERTNRRLRQFEKVRYKWQRRRTIVRFVILAMQRWHHRRMAETQGDVGHDPMPATLSPCHPPT